MTLIGAREPPSSWRPGRAPRAQPRTGQYLWGRPSAAAKFPRRTAVAGPEPLGRAGTLAPVFGRSKTAAAEEATASSRSRRPAARAARRPSAARPRSGRRRAVAAPQDRKEAYKRQRARQREERTQQMAALQGRRRAQPAGPRPRPGAALRARPGRRPPVGGRVLPAVRAGDPGAVVQRSNSRLKAIGSTLWLALVVLIVARLGGAGRASCAAGLAKNLRRPVDQGRAALRADAQHADPPVPAPAAATAGRPPPQRLTAVAPGYPGPGQATRARGAFSAVWPGRARRRRRAPRRSGSSARPGSCTPAGLDVLVRPAPGRDAPTRAEATLSFCSTQATASWAMREARARRRPA